MKRTLLDIVQEILSSMDSDEVNSINDTVESRQVANVVRSSYFNMLGRYDLPENNQLFQLTSSGDMDQPVLMTIPTGINRIEWIKYYDTGVSSDPGSDYDHDVNLDLDDSADDTSSSPSFREMRILPVKEFINMVNGFNLNETNVASFELDVTNQSTAEINTFTFRFKNDQAPTYCTVLQDYYVIFDSYDESQDDTLQSSKTMCYGWVLPAFTLTDDFIPLIDEQQFPLLVNEAKSLAFLELKQTMHPKAEREVQRQMSSLQKFKSVVNKPTAFNQLPHFGRKR